MFCCFGAPAVKEEIKPRPAVQAPVQIAADVPNLPISLDSYKINSDQEVNNVNRGSSNLVDDYNAPAKLAAYKVQIDQVVNRLSFAKGNLTNRLQYFTETLSQGLDAALVSILYLGADASHLMVVASAGSLSLCYPTGSILAINSETDGPNNEAGEDDNLAGNSRRGMPPSANSSFSLGAFASGLKGREGSVGNNSKVGGGGGSQTAMKWPPTMHPVAMLGSNGSISAGRASSTGSTCHGVTIGQLLLASEQKVLMYQNLKPSDVAHDASSPADPQSVNLKFGKDTVGKDTAGKGTKARNSGTSV
eukprot:CAMPEP_0175066644 /NCGR_PEP_ID=MMETSP0052_2-20121109/16634_1 /TAXON_ID=51329 ORGANISM="Polytomella parva, Strain SAG 63-3" /NCGR_SAMPLE_ID=MMETSP0052_2 /ASSEMBLY_ACC=CAM_ASM_000194 /LENGTH=304 /DNA_ID=CAMNT_0016333391 /DNA_START=48 /DNA_END=958 /DNA_ORIENTATION=+